MEGEKASQPAHNTPPNQSRAVYSPRRCFFGRFDVGTLIESYLCVDWWVLAVYYHTFSSPTNPLFPLNSLLSSLCFFSVSLSARPPSLLLWGAHDQELPRHSSRRPAQRAPGGRAHRRSVPGCHVHASQTGHAHGRQQPSAAGSAHPQRLKIASPSSCQLCGTVGPTTAVHEKSLSINCLFLYVEDLGSPWQHFASLPLLKK